MDKITNKLSTLDIKREKIYQINGIDYTEKEFYEKYYMPERVKLIQTIKCKCSCRSVVLLRGIRRHERTKIHGNKNKP